jgi:hypothetical protein
MSQGIVDFFKTIQIDIRHAERLSGAIGSCQLFNDLLVKLATVGNAGEMVGLRKDPYMCKSKFKFLRKCGASCILF